ncbi:putative RNA-directed DNA polymerase, eukaryota, reverse transcriptase zinc-binding domain protein [Tanacetum coccineum]
MKYSIKSRNQRSRIDVITTVDNVMVHGNCVPNVFVSHYESFIGTDMVCEDLNISGLFNKQVSEISNANMIRSVTNEEIKRAMFDIGDDKTPGPDGYTSAFFKRGWDVVGLDVCNAIRDFFDNGQILKEINHTLLALIPKELMHNYHRNRGPPRCAFKVDIQKAYDTVDWRFLGFILKCFGFHHTMIKWIMTCVTSASFSISGNIHGFFKGKRGLRQGDPLSPYLFTLVMEILTLILKRRVRLSDTFRYHNHCEDLDIINVCFADDLFIFARGDVESVRAIMDSLDEFKHVSGLCAWEVLRPRGQQVMWYHITWFSHCILRHAFHLWLVMRRCLKKQDKLRSWDVDASTDLSQLRCSLCGSHQDSHEHLFFKCTFSSQVWNSIRNLAGMEHVPLILEDIVMWFNPMANNRSFKNVVVNFVGYPKKTMRYHFYNPHENKVSVARYAELFENSLKFTRSGRSLTLLKESGSLTLQKASGSNAGLELFQEKDT